MRSALVVVALALAAALGATPDRVAFAQRGSVVVFAAASLKNALDEANAQWTAGGKPAATIAYAASSALAKQIESGAPADVFVSADIDWMEYVAQRKLIQEDTRKNLLGNTLVLVAPADSELKLEIAPGFALARALGGDGKLAMADTAAVPAGKYGKAALEKLGVWDQVKDRLAPAENVRAALLLVSRGEAPLGIVYGSDAVSEPKVRVVGTFPEDSHPPILYPVALTRSAADPDAAGFLRYLQSPAVRPVFEKQGFEVLLQI